MGTKEQLFREQDLWERRDQDPQARDELVNRYMTFARSVAIRFRHQSESFDDLLQVANLGLVNAVNRYEPDRGIPFIAFASPTINGELKRHFRDRTSTIRLPRSLYDRIGRIEKAIGDLTSQLHRDPSLEEIADETGFEAEEVSEAFEAGHNRHPVSLDQSPMSNGEETIAPVEWIGHDDEGFETKEHQIVLKQAMHDLNKEERLVVRLRFGEDLTQSEIADRIGHSQMHVSRTLRKVLNRLEDRLPAAA